ncbi:ATP-binding protein [Lusitaniella coriacea]|uniref:ATP-binding protein n=1 Tax=Lusitaniella coriacea TaxID=1983105 RepID=UPI003CFB9141
MTFKRLKTALNQRLDIDRPSRVWWGSSAIAICAIAALTLTSYFLVRGRFLHSLKLEALARVELEAKELDEWLATQKAALETLAATPLLREWDGSTLERPAEPDGGIDLQAGRAAARLRAYLQRELERNPEWAALAFVNAKGERLRVARAEDSDDFLPLVRPRGGETFVSDPFPAPETRTSVLFVAVPVPPTLNATLIASIPATRLQQAAEELDDHRGSYTFVLNSAGRVIVAPDSTASASGKDPATALLHSQQPQEVALAVKMSRGERGIDKLRLSGKPVYAAYFPMVETDWSVGLALPKAQIESQLTFLDFLFAGAGAFLLIAAILALQKGYLLETSRRAARIETILNRLQNEVYGSFDLTQTLPQILTELLEALALERVAFGWVRAQPAEVEVEIAAERVEPGRPSWLGTWRCPKNCWHQVLRGQTLALVGDGCEAQIILLEGQYRAIALLPGTDEAAVALCCAPHKLKWQPTELKLLQDTAQLLTNAITRSRLYAQSLAAARAQSQFLANMSHEIRTPLHAAIGTTELLLATALSPQQRDYAQTLFESSNHLLALLNDILDFSKLEAEPLELECREFHLGHLLEGAIAILAPLAERKSLELAVRCRPNCSGTFLGDEVKLREILLNLAGNAIKFTESGSVVVAAAREEPSDPDATDIAVRFAVIDTGIGIAPEDREKLFQAFCQLDPSNSRAYGGTGLGLAICQRLVEGMGGEIGVESKPGGGSTFWFVIPLQRADARPDAETVPSPRPVAPSPCHPISLPASTPDARILVVDDRPTNQTLLVEQLQHLGFSAIDRAGDGERALQCLRSRRYDLVFMDCQMPSLDGYETTRQLRAIEAEQGIHTTAIALTASVSTADRRACFAAGMDDFLSKPVRLSVLAAALERWLTAPVDGEQLDAILGGKTEPIAPLMRAFLEHASADIAELEEAIARRESERVSIVAHRLKGAAASLAVRHIPQQLERLDAIVRQRQFQEAASSPTVIEACLIRLQRWVEEMEGRGDAERSQD